jgi:hypothetical protein
MQELSKLHLLVLVVVGHVVIADEIRDTCGGNLVYPPGNYSLAWCPTAMPCVVVPRSNEISTTSQQAVDTFSQGVKMRGKSAFEATQPPPSQSGTRPAIAPLGKTKTPIRSVHEQVWNDAEDGAKESERNWQ